MVSFTRHLYIEREDYMEHREPKYKRLCPGEGGECGLECRLKGAYLVRCAGFVTDESGEVTEVLCEYDPESRGGDPADGRKVKGATLHWVDANNCADAEIRLYSNLFTDPDPDAAGDAFVDLINPDSLEVLTGCKVEHMLADESSGTHFQFLREGYFARDKDSADGRLVFNRAVELKGSYRPAGK